MCGLMDVHSKFCFIRTKLILLLLLKLCRIAKNSKELLFLLLKLCRMSGIWKRRLILKVKQILLSVSRWRKIQLISLSNNLVIFMRKY